jgi:hypothetical protein
MLEGGDAFRLHDPSQAAPPGWPFPTFLMMSRGELNRANLHVEMMNLNV